MSAITGTEPAHWHDGGGKHKMADPRTIEGYQERWWDADERRYVTHLETHEGERSEQRSDPQPSAEDSPAVRSLFALLDARERECQTIRELIVAQRDLATAQKAL